MVVVKYQGNKYGLFGHLNTIATTEGSSVSVSSFLGTMGTTGCAGCGTHLHLGILKPINSHSVDLLTTRDWQGLINTINSSAKAGYKPFCTYLAPNGEAYAFEDPSGWSGVGKDPWSTPRSKGGCGVNSSYLWKYSLVPLP